MVERITGSIACIQCSLGMALNKEVAVTKEQKRRVDIICTTLAVAFTICFMSIFQMNAYADTSELFTAISDLFTNLRSLIIGIITSLGALLITWTGIKWAVAAGKDDPTGVQSAKKNLSHIIVGIAIALFATLIITTVMDLVDYAS